MKHFTQPVQIGTHIPAEISEFACSYRPTTDDDARMRFVLAACEKSLEWEFGGPFSAAVFEQETGKLVALGVNLIVAGNLSILHAEIVALSLAQTAVEHFDLSAEHLPRYELFTSTEPCTMCLGASHWSGVRRVVAAARDSDAAAIGFDEGPKPENWAESLRQRGIDVDLDVQRAEAIRILQAYQNKAGLIYNAIRNT